MILLVFSVLVTGCSNNMGKENTEETEQQMSENPMSENPAAENDISEIKELEPDSGEAASVSRYSCIAVEDGFELTFYSSTNEIIFSEWYPKEPAISQVTENIFEIRINVGSPAAYVFYFDTENAEESETFFNPLLVGDRYVAYIEDGKLILQDIFHEGLLYMTISRDFTQTADPMSAIVAIEMQDEGTITLSYYKGENYEETSEVITIYSYEVRESQYTLNLTSEENSKKLNKSYQSRQQKDYFLRHLFLTSCETAGTENKIEDRKTGQFPESVDVCQFIRDYDFSQQEYPIDRALYTADVEQEFINAFYEAITNQVPLEYEDTGAVYFRNWFRGIGEDSDPEFLEGIKMSKYRLIDMDGDGLPELALQFGWELCVLRYDMDEKRVKGYFGPAESWILLGSDRFGLHDTGSPGLERNEYLFLGGRDRIKQTIYFERDTMYETRCTVSASGAVNNSVSVSEEEWEELAEGFFYSLNHPVEFVTFEEIFGEAADRQPASAEDVEKAQKAYREFLAGERSAGNVTISDILETAAGGAEYLIHDVSGDGVPELHIQTEDKYYIIACQQGCLFVWFTRGDYYGGEGRYDVLESGEVVYSHLQAGSEYYLYWEIQPSAEVMVNLSFGREDINGDGIYDGADTYEYDMRTMKERYSGLESAQIVTMEEWLDKMSDYLYLDENGSVWLLGKLEWTDL